MYLNANNAKTVLEKEIILAAKNCNGNLFSDWRYAKIALRFLYGKRIVDKYELYLRNKFVIYYGKF